VIVVVRPGVGTTVQDLGRTGLAHLGVTRSGAVDHRSHDLVNRLVGNAADAATIETSGGLSFRTTHAVTVVLGGASCLAEVRHGPPLGHLAPVSLPARAEVLLSRPFGGARTYVAVRGGLHAEVVLGSRSRDTLGGIGPSIASGTEIEVGPDPGSPMVVDAAAQPEPNDTIEIVASPRRHLFTDDAWRSLVTQAFTVTVVDRIGVRLAGPPLDVIAGAVRERPPEGLVEGAIQVPADGQPIVMLADHPVTGGYPVIAVASWRSIPDVAQAVPGATLRFRPAR